MTQEWTSSRPRVDASEKVLGRALFAADQPIAGVLHGMTAPATIAKGINRRDCRPECAGRRARLHI